MVLQLNKTGQVGFEAIICIALLFALIAAALGTVNSLKSASEKNEEMILAEARAQKCSVMANILYSNSGGKIVVKENCYAEKEHEIKSVLNGREKSAFTIAEKVSSVQAGEKTVLEVAVNEHYG